MSGPSRAFFAPELSDPVQASHDRESGAPSRLWLGTSIICWIVIQGFFAGTAFRVDETNIIAIAKQIAVNPFDPYGFYINWLGIPERAFDILANPPFVPLWLASSAKLLGWSEVALHVCMIPFSVIGILAMASLSADLRLPVRAAVVLLVVSPAYFVCSQVVMPDAAMTALFMTAVAGALRYRSTGRRTALAISCAAGFLTPLAKYNGVLAVPVLAVVWLISSQRKRGLAVAALAPLLGLGAWSVYSLLYYGRVHFLHIAEFEQAGFENIFSSMIPAFGLGVVPVAAMAYSIRHRRGAIVEVASAATALLFGAAGFLVFEYRPVPGVLFTIAAWIVARVVLTALLAIPLPANWRDDRVVMLVWIAAGLVMQFHVLFASVRYLLLLLPPVLLLLLMTPAVEYHERLRNGTAVLCGLLAVAIAIGDARIANISRSFVVDVVVPLHRREGGRLFFDGHWGFQYYAERAGAKVINGWRPPVWREHDVFVIARNAAPWLQMPPKVKSVRLELTNYDLSPRWPVRTIDCGATANFYGPGTGPCKMPVLPFGFATGPSDEFGVYVARQEVP